MGDLLPEITEEGKTPSGTCMFDLNKEIPSSSVTKEGKTPTEMWMFDLNKEIPRSSAAKNDKTPTGIWMFDLNKEIPRSSSLASLELLNRYGNRMKRANQDQQNDPSKDETCNSIGTQVLSTVEILKVAVAKFMNAISSSSGDVSMLMHPFDGAHSSLPCEVTEDVDLILLLLASANKLADQLVNRARKLLSMCNCMASPSGNPVQRVVYYFAEALGDRIDSETGIASSDSLEGIKRWQSRLVEDITIGQPSALAFRKELPFIIAAESAGMQVILDSMASEKRIHLIDLQIRSGPHWTILMQALAVRRECPLEMLKITAVGTTSIQMIEATGRRLSSFAESMSLPFSFKIVVLSDEKDLSEDLFELEAGDAVGIYSALLLWNMKARRSLIRVIKNLCPIVMVVTETETNTDPPSFMDRITEALFFYSASFDALEACMDRDDPYRMILEGNYYRGGIENIIKFESEGRIICHMKIDGWRAFFKKFGMMEREMSMSSLYQARLMVDKYACGSSCTLDMDGKCLLVGWKGTPLLSLSAWKFLQQEN